MQIMLQDIPPFFEISIPEKVRRENKYKVVISLRFDVLHVFVHILSKTSVFDPTIQQFYV